MNNTRIRIDERPPVKRWSGRPSTPESWIFPWPTQVQTIIEANSAHASFEASPVAQVEKRSEALRNANPSEYNEQVMSADSSPRHRLERLPLERRARDVMCPSAHESGF
jgi:hypothetical protein